MAAKTKTPTGKEYKLRWSKCRLRKERESLKGSSVIYRNTETKNWKTYGRTRWHGEREHLWDTQALGKFYFILWGQGLLHLEFNTLTRERWDLEQGSGDDCSQPRSAGQPKKAKLIHKEWVRSGENQEPKQKPGKSATCLSSELHSALDIFSQNKYPWDWKSSNRIEKIPRKRQTAIWGNTEKKIFGQDKQWDGKIDFFSAEEMERSKLTSHTICDLIYYQRAYGYCCYCTRGTCSHTKRQHISKVYGEILLLSEQFPH